MLTTSARRVLIERIAGMLMAGRQFAFLQRELLLARPCHTLYLTMTSCMNTSRLDNRIAQHFSCSSSPRIFTVSDKKGPPISMTLTRSSSEQVFRIQQVLTRIRALRRRRGFISPLHPSPNKKPNRHLTKIPLKWRNNFLEISRNPNSRGSNMYTEKLFRMMT